MNPHSDADSSERPPRVSVVVPTYNYGHLIAQTLDSVRAQTMADWECIVVDDGSTDDTPAVLRQYIGDDPRFIVIRQQNAGLSAARNAGIIQARGVAIQLLDADDLLEPGKLKTQFEFLESHPETGIVYGEVRYFRTEHPQEHTLSLDGGNYDWSRRLNGAGPDIVGALIRGNVTTVNTPLVRRTVFETVGHFDEELTANEDWAYWLRCALAGVRFDFESAPNTLALVRSHPDNMTHDRVRMWSTRLKVRDKIDGLLQDVKQRELNRDLEHREKIQLALESSLAHQNALRRYAALLRTGLAAKNLRVFVYALLLPALRSRMLRPLVRSANTRRGRGEAT